MSLDATILFQLAANYSPTAVYDFQSPSAPSPWAKQFALTNGAGLNQADRLFIDQRPLNASTNDDIDLAGGLTDVFGQTITLARVKGLFVYSYPANVQNFTVAPGATNSWNTWVTGTTPAIVVRPGGFFFLYAPDATGYAVTAATGDLMRIANGAGQTINYDLVVLGSST